MKSNVKEIKQNNVLPKSKKEAQNLLKNAVETMTKNFQQLWAQEKC